MAGQTIGEGANTHSCGFLTKHNLYMITPSRTHTSFGHGTPSCCRPRASSGAVHSDAGPRTNSPSQPPPAQRPTCQCRLVHALSLFTHQFLCVFKFTMQLARHIHQADTRYNCRVEIPLFATARRSINHVAKQRVSSSLLSFQRRSRSIPPGWHPICLELDPT